MDSRQSKAKQNTKTKRIARKFIHFIGIDKRIRCFPANWRVFRFRWKGYETEWLHIFFVQSETEYMFIWTPTKFRRHQKMCLLFKIHCNKSYMQIRCLNISFDLALKRTLFHFLRLSHERLSCVKRARNWCKILWRY